uniref:Uncharacterized protein n=1 Tax=Plectus sambesii TaxID=2011161 RepID=A0A914W570_9BILA
MATPYGSEIATVMEQHNNAMQREGSGTRDTVTQDEEIDHENKKHSTLAEGFECTEYGLNALGERMVSLDEVMLHQNRVLHNEDGFKPEDYRK